MSSSLKRTVTITSLPGTKPVISRHGEAQVASYLMTSLVQERLFGKSFWKVKTKKVYRIHLLHLRNAHGDYELENWSSSPAPKGWERRKLFELLSTMYSNIRTGGLAQFTSKNLGTVNLRASL